MDWGSPVVLLDVDGVLNPVVRPHRGYRRHRATPDGITYRLWLNAAHGRLLLDLAEATGAELIWATYWRDAANDWIAPRVGLPRLPFVPIPRQPLDSDLTVGGWKARHVARWAAGRPFVWFEDEPDVTECLAAEADLGPHFVVQIDPYKGLVEGHLDRARAWLAEMEAQPG